MPPTLPVDECLQTTNECKNNVRVTRYISTVLVLEQRRCSTLAETVIAYTKDGMWRVDLVAFMLNDFVYKAIGSTIRAYHWEVGGALWWRKERWVEKSVDFLSTGYRKCIPSFCSSCSTV
jgi:hypothetical protein